MLRVEHNWAQVEFVGGERTTRGWMKPAISTLTPHLNEFGLASRQSIMLPPIPILLRTRAASAVSRGRAASSESCRKAA